MLSGQQSRPAPAGASGASSNSSSAGAVKYVESFENPYVKIILVCKICNKEMNMKRTDTWKVHYFTHVSNENKPYKCPHCDQGFVQPAPLNKHIQKKHGKTEGGQPLSQPNFGMFKQEANH